MRKLSPPDQPIPATCNCGDITLTAPGHPEEAINECQCTICRRYGAEWAYYNTNGVKIEKKDGASMRTWDWGEKPQNKFYSCSKCMVIIMWYPNEVKEGGSQMGLNSRLMDPEAIKGVNRIKCFDDLYR